MSFCNYFVVATFTTIICVAFVDSSPVAANSCQFSSGSIIGAVLGTFFSTLVLCLVTAAVIRMVCLRHQGKASGDNRNLASVSRHGGHGTQSGHDNQSFDSGTEEITTAVAMKLSEAEDTQKQLSSVEGKGSKPNTTVDDTKQGNAPINQNLSVSSSRRNQVLQKGPGPKQDAHIITVSLKSQDIIGLGFNISGNTEEGIYVSQVHNRGPAKESGLIKQGDRILQMTISFESIEFEDALTILSYASPYPVQLRLQKAQADGSSKVLIRTPQSEVADTLQDAYVVHPLFRGHSVDDISLPPRRPPGEDDPLPPFGSRRAWSEWKKRNPKATGVWEAVVRPPPVALAVSESKTLEAETATPLNVESSSSDVEKSEVTISPPD